MTAARRAATVTAVLVALATVVPAAVADDAPSSRLSLSVHAPDGTLTREVRLDCDPAGGPHPHADEACAALESADGGFEDLPPARHFCPMIYAPVIAKASGDWHGRPVEWTRDFPNACVLDQRTGVVFRF